MDAPDKIYRLRTTGNRRLNSMYYKLKPAKIRYDDKIIEYIRKDVLLKWVKKELQTNTWYYETHKKPSDLHYGRIEAFKQLIDKIESL